MRPIAASKTKIQSPSSSEREGEDIEEHCNDPTTDDNVEEIGDVDPQAIAAINKAVKEKQPVLVHCSAGSQRTGGVIAMYRLLVQKQSVLPILEEMEQYDWDSEDDQVLSIYLDKYIAILAERLVSLSVIEAVPSHLPSFVANVEARDLESATR